MKQHREDVMPERPPQRANQRRLGRGFAMVVGAVGLLACGVLGGVVRVYS